MIRRTDLASASLRALLVLGLATLASALTPSSAPATAQTIGPDVTVHDVGGIVKWGSFLSITAYSFATVSCNQGDALAAWEEFTDQHPVIACNMYRLENGRFEQIGISWLKHGFCALSEPGCGPCAVPTGCETLAIGCADTYGATLNGTQGGLGPRYEVNPATGEFPYPFATSGITGPVLYKRLQVEQNKLDPALHPGATYFYEAQYIHPEEPTWGTQYNNVSHRELTVGAFDDGWELSPAGSTYTESPAIEAWQAADPEVVLEPILVPDDGELILGARASDLGGGQWHYEYALYNMNSDRAARSLSISLPPGAVVTNVGFHDIHYHSGEPFSPADWDVSVLPDRVLWQTETFAEDENANAVRWGTIYNFRFDCDVAPDTSDAHIGLFKPGTGSTQIVQIPGPGVTPCTTPDFVRGNVNGDLAVDISDVVYALAYLFQSGPEPLPILEAGDVNDDGAVDVSDPVYLLAYLFTGGSEPPYPFPDPGCE